MRGSRSVRFVPEASHAATDDIVAWSPARPAPVGRLRRSNQSVVRHTATDLFRTLSALDTTPAVDTMTLGRPVTRRLDAWSLVIGLPHTRHARMSFSSQATVNLGRSVSSHHLHRSPSIPARRLAPRRCSRLSPSTSRSIDDLLGPGRKRKRRR